MDTSRTIVPLLNLYSTVFRREHAVPFRWRTMIGLRAHLCLSRSIQLVDQSVRACLRTCHTQQYRTLCTRYFPLPTPLHEVSSCTQRQHEPVVRDIKACEHVACPKITVSSVRRCERNKVLTIRPSPTTAILIGSMIERQRVVEMIWKWSDRQWGLSQRIAR
jgi:hypothetical protein